MGATVGQALEMRVSHQFLINPSDKTHKLCPCPLHKRIIIALITGLVVGFVVMVLLDGPANADTALRVDPSGLEDGGQGHVERAAGGLKHFPA